MYRKKAKSDTLIEPLTKAKAQKLIFDIAHNYPSNIFYTKHASRRLKQRKLHSTDVMNVIKSSSARVYGDPRLENGTYRYKVETTKIAVVIGFNSKTEMSIITAWKK